LWRTDGTEAGTQLVADMYSGSLSSDPNDLVEIAGWVYFTAENDTYGRELWRTNGVHTERVTDLAPGSLPALRTYGAYLTSMNVGGVPQVFFAARDAAASAGHGLELWRVPVTAAGVPAAPVLIEIAAGARSSFPAFLTMLGDTLYFAAEDAPGNLELWKSNGTSAGTTRVADILPGEIGSSPELLTAWNDRLVFRAIQPSTGNEPWISDGTVQGTSILSNIHANPFMGGASPKEGLWMKIGGKPVYFFGATDGMHGFELWRTDGTREGTRMVKDVAPGFDSGIGVTYELEAMGGLLYFIGYDPEYGENIWRSDGTEQGTWMIKNLAPEDREAYPWQLTAAGKKLYFTATDPAHGHELWVTDGTSDGTGLLFDSIPGPAFPFVYRLAGVDQQVFFVTEKDWATDRFDLWRSDGTVQGTRRILGPVKTDHSDSTPSLKWFFPYGNSLFLNMNIDTPENLLTTGNRLWITDGTTAGTKMLQTSGGKAPWNPSFFRRSGDTLYFIEEDPNTMSGAFVSTISLGTSLVQRTSVTTSRYVHLFDPLDENWFGLVGLDDYGWYSYKPFIALVNIATGADASPCPGTKCYPETITDAEVWAGEIIFVGEDDDATYPSGLWRSDGATKTGTQVFAAPTTGKPYTRVGFLHRTPTDFYFAANDGVNGVGLWVVRSAPLKPDKYITYLPTVNR
jgi:ELWxxDGT repeat protein